jgi:cytochrome c oxidase subunit 2
VRFLFTSSDVIHSWWVPAFGVKKDAIPGFINEAWARVTEPGIYRGQCAELCGANHGFMPIVVEAKSEQDYLAWVHEKKAAMAAVAASADKTWTMDELMAQGEPAYNTNCGACHQANGEGIPNVFPGLKGSAIAIGDIAAHIDIVLHGKAGTAMQAFGPQLSDADLAAIITYERNAWGNNTGDMVQPSDVKSARK